MTEAYARFFSSDNAWMHNALDIIDSVFGVSDIDYEIDSENHLVVNVRCDEV